LFDTKIKDILQIILCKNYKIWSQEHFAKRCVLNFTVLHSWGRKSCTPLGCL